MQYFLFAVVVLVLLVILWNRHTKIQLRTQNQRMEQQKNMQYRYFSERIAQNKVLYDLHNQSVAQWTEIVALAKNRTMPLCAPSCPHWTRSMNPYRV